MLHRRKDYVCSFEILADGSAQKELSVLLPVLSVLSLLFRRVLCADGFLSVEVKEQRPGWSAVLNLIALDLSAFFKPSSNNPGQDHYYEERRSKKVNKSLQ